MPHRSQIPEALRYAPRTKTTSMKLTRGGSIALESSLALGMMNAELVVKIGPNKMARKRGVSEADVKRWLTENADPVSLNRFLAASTESV